MILWAHRKMSCGPSAFAEASADRRSLGGGWSGPPRLAGLKACTTSDVAMRAYGNDVAMRAYGKIDRKDFTPQ
jgi:hypothetical protein